jgi:hypothetical protein
MRGMANAALWLPQATLGYMRSHTSLDIFGLEGQVPEIKVKGETVGISTIAEY